MSKSFVCVAVAAVVCGLTAIVSMPAGCSLSADEISLLRGGQSSSTSTADRACGCDTDCELPVEAEICSMFDGDQPSCLAHGDIRQEYSSNDMPQACIVDQYGTSCEVDGEYPCLIKYECRFNLLLESCTTDFSSGLPEQQGATTCSDYAT